MSLQFQVHLKVKSSTPSNFFYPLQFQTFNFTFFSLVAFHWTYLKEFYCFGRYPIISDNEKLGRHYLKIEILSINTAKWMPEVRYSSMELKKL